MKEQDNQNNDLSLETKSQPSKAKKAATKSSTKKTIKKTSSKASSSGSKKKTTAFPKFTYKKLMDDDEAKKQQPEVEPPKDNENKKVKKEKKAKQKDTEPKPKKKFNTRSFVSMLVLFVLGISSGLFAGNWYATNFISGPPTDYSLYTESELKENNARFATEYASKVPVADSAWKSFIAAEKNFSSATSFDILSNGVVDTIVTQSVYSRKIYNGTKVFVEQISDGMVAVADRFVYEPSKFVLENKDTHIVRTKGKLSGTKLTDEHLNCEFGCKHGNKNAYVYNTNYNGAVTTMTEDEYVEALGGMPLAPIAYIVSDKTVVSCGNFKVVGSGDSTRYTFSLNLHPGASVLNYVKQMKTVSGLSAYPNFTEVRLDVSLQMLDGKVMFDYFCVYEKYSVNYGSLTPKCTGTLHQRFLFNGDYEIPA